MKATRSLFRQPLMLLLSAALVASISSARAQVASNAPPAPPAGAVAAKTSSADQVVELSPFEVNATKDAGYFTANTLAGTRLNNNIADLPSSITVVTKQQLEDTGSLNINDVFRYEANTEGARTYTQYVMIRTNLADANGGGGGTTGSYVSAATTGNRVRGLANADTEVDNFFSQYRIPFDSYNTQAVEIDRGPNSIIYGSGSPAGIVNQARTQANANKLSGQVSLMGGSWGTYRETFSANVPLIKDRLGIYVAQMFGSVGFEQKPSSDLTRRQYGAFVLYPFKNHRTKIAGSFEYFNNYANDPNGITPVDYVTPWIASGMPTWNPITDVVSYLASGKIVGPYALSTTYPNYNPAVGSVYWTPGSGPIQQANLTTSTSPYWVPGLGVESTGHRVMFISQGKLENFYNGAQTGLSNPGWVPSTFTTSQALVNEQRMTFSAALPWPSQTTGANAGQLKYASWSVPGINSKSIYDWSTINVNSMNNTQTTSKTYNLSVDQEILSNLHLQVAWFRQELKQLQDDPTSQANATQFFVDTNTTMPNGQTNPHLGQPFIQVYQTDVYSEPENNNNWREMLVFEPDLRKYVPSWLSWLGHHRFMAVISQHDDVSTNLRYRPAIDGGDSNYMPTTTAYTATAGYSFAGSNNAIEQWYYLGGATAAAPGYAASSAGFFNRPGYGGPTWANINTYNYVTGTWGTSQVHMDSLLYAGGGLSENIQDSKTFFWQGFLWKDRIVVTLGIDDDQVKSRSSLFPTSSNATALEFPNGMPDAKDYWYNYGPWYYIGGNTSTTGLVLHAFKDWEPIDRAADSGNIFAAVLRTLSFTFNKSDNFNPPTAYYTDFFGNPLGKPIGTEKDYGVEIATPDNKLFVRATWFQTTSENALFKPTSQGRAVYIDNNELKQWATDVVEIRNGYEFPSDQNWNNVNVYPVTTAMQAQISSLTGLPYNFGGNVGPQGQYVSDSYGNESGKAKGVEIEATYNPLPNWTMKFSWGKQQTTVSGVASQAQAWVDYRMPTWTTAAAPDITTIYPVQGKSASPLSLASFWNGYGYANTSFSSVNGASTVKNYYTNVVGAQLATDEANNGQLAPNQREYSWSYLTNYTFDRGPAKNLGFGGAVSYSGQSTAGYYADPTKTSLLGTILAPNVLQPIYTPAQYHIDAWISYKMPLGSWAGNKISCMIQFNVQDLTSTGKLLPVQFNWDGSPAAFRIIAPRSYSLTTKFAF